MIHMGLIGFPLAHSYSQRLHERALDVLGLEGKYHLWEIPPLPQGKEELISKLKDLREGHLKGANVTIPHKRSVLYFVDRLTPMAQAVGAVNTLYLDPQRDHVVGENTDSPGFWVDVRKVLLTVRKGEKPRALILGAGGAARAATHALLTHGWSVSIAARRISQAESVAKHFGDQGRAVEVYHLSERASLKLEACRLIVNATPVGMAPDTASSPWPQSWEFPKKALVYDLVYNPAQTLFMRQARGGGLEVRNGLGMLVEQAALAFKRWTGAEPPRREMLEVVR
ncbi:MAG: shikimate dehydrogenase [Anaerolineales bacterium]